MKKYIKPLAIVENLATEDLCIVVGSGNSQNATGVQLSPEDSAWDIWGNDAVVEE